MLLLRMIFGKLELWQWILMAVVLIPSAVRDIRTKRINGFICLVGILGALFVRERLLGESSQTLMKDLLPGVVTYVVAFFSDERIGKGDAVTLMFIGAVAGIETVLLSMFISFSAAAALSAVLLMLKKVGKNTRLPFLPCLSLGVLAGGLL